MRDQSGMGKKLANST